jgi:hypothetical protein
VVCGTFIEPSHKLDTDLPAGGGVVRLRPNKQRAWRAVVFACALVVTSLVAMSGSAHAGFFDFLFGGPEQRPGGQSNSYADPSRPVTPPALGSESVRQNGAISGSGRAAAFCVRLCDGRNFPLERSLSTPIETCRSMCPASKTDVFFGSEIDHAVTRSGQRYPDSDNAYVYRKQMVANCTCNGKDAFGLAHLDVKNDPTLRPGDMVETKTGLVVYTGRSGQVALFTPVGPSDASAELSAATARTRLSQRTTAAAADAPETIAPPPMPQQQPLGILDMRGQVDR